jgi:hypothetical protein
VINFGPSKKKAILRMSFIHFRILLIFIFTLWNYSRALIIDICNLKDTHINTAGIFKGYRGDSFSIDKGFVSIGAIKQNIEISPIIFQVMTKLPKIYERADTSDRYHCPSGLRIGNK